VLSRRHKTIFVHIPKAGGTSVEWLFRKDAGIAWPNRSKLLLGPNPDQTRGPTRLSHLYAREYVELGHISRRDYARFAKFALVRHPIDRMLSEYRYRVVMAGRRNQGPPDFDAFIRQDLHEDRSDIARHLVPQVRYLTDAQGVPIVLDAFHLERFEEDARPFLERILTAPFEMPHRNPTDLSIGPRREDLTQTQTRFLRDRYAEDFELLGYSV
jgi:hypothetical protein